MLLLFDIGGTTTRVAVTDGTTLDTSTVRSYPTPPHYQDGLEKLGEVGQELLAGQPVNSIVGGVPGPLNSERSRLLNAPNLVDWKEKPLREDLGTLFGTKQVYLENDAALAGLGEALFGAGKEYSSVMYYTISTGVGGARVIDGKIDSGIATFEPGHQFMDMNKSLEQLIAGSSLEKQWGSHPSAIDNQDIWDDVEMIAAYGLHNSIVHWAPDVVILGGGLVRSGKVSIDRIRERLLQIMYIYPNVPPFKMIELGDFSALWGGVGYVNFSN